MKFTTSPRSLDIRLGAGARCLLLVLATLPASAGIVDVWRADSLNLNDGDAVGTWTSASNRTVNGGIGEQPTFKRGGTPGGGAVVRFNPSFMTTSLSPVGGATAFSIAIVFKASAAGAAADGSPWYQCSGLVDAEQGGVVNDWGTVFNGSGHVAIGTGSPDITTPSQGASLVDSSFHVAVFTWGGGSQSVYVDSRPVVTQTGTTSAARNNGGFAFGGILTGEGGTARRFIGDMAEVRFYNAALTSLEASNVIDELRTTHIIGNLPRPFFFTASSNQILLGQSILLSWAVSNALSVVIDNGVGAVSLTNSLVLSPAVTTTYTLTATNTNGVRTLTATVAVDPGIPIASSFSTNTGFNTPVAIMLRGSDPQGSNLTYSIVTPPAHGSLSGAPPNVTYLPVQNFGGLDAFTFKVNDGQFDSAPATVSLNVIPPALPPSGIALSTTNITTSAGPGALLALLQAIDVNIPYGDSHTFGLVSGFGDNAKFTVTGNSLVAGPDFTGGPGATFNIRLRATDSTSLSITQDFHLVAFDAPRSVVINEIHYNPDYNPIRESFIELYNDTDSAMNISQWRLSGGVDFTFPSGTTLAPRAFTVVAESPATILSRYGKTALGPWIGGLNNEGETVTLRDANGAKVDEVSFKSEFPWPIASDGGGPSAQLVNPGLDNDLGSSWRSGVPTPGATNSVFSTNGAPNIRQVGHAPNTPSSTNQVVITAKVTDPEGVASVQLQYQIVIPGNYVSSVIPLSLAQLNPLTNPALQPGTNAAFENPANWATLPMVDNGTGGDVAAGDNIYTAILPPQGNRVLVRYRIVATDGLGAARRAPFEDDPSLNFAYFVYDGIPAYAGYSPAVMQTLPVYFLLTRSQDFDDCTGYTTAQLNQFNGSVANEGRYAFNWEGAFVYEGKVYDHVRYRLEGANGRYQTGRRNFTVKFNDGRQLEAKDQNFKPYPKKWSRLNIAKGQSNRGTVTFGLNEAMTYGLCNKVGVPAPLTHYMHWRVIKGAQEQPDLYNGDFYGVFMIQENYDTRFLDTHGLEKGTLYKLINAPKALPAGGSADMLGQQRYQGAFAPTNAEDAVISEAVLLGPNPRHDTSTLLAYVNYPKWFLYHSIAEAVRDYDFWPDANKNAGWYFEPAYGASNSFGGRLWTLPWDATDTWGPTWNAGQDICYAGIFQGTPNPELQIQYFNTVREVRDLLIQPDQVKPMIDALAGPLGAIMPANLARWSNSPTAGSSYRTMPIPGPALSGGLAAYAQDMKNFLFAGGSYTWWVGGESVGAGGWAAARLDSWAADSAIPIRPTLTYVGTSGYPIDSLVFQSSAFSDPQGAGTFAAMQWRIAEVLPPGAVVSNVSQLRFEWDAAHLSPEITTFNALYAFPDYVTQPELLYRARVRHKDNSGRWSQWSLPVDFQPSARDTVSQLRTNLVLSEIMYNPPGAGAVDGDEFEFIELQNTGPFTLRLGGLFFSSGVTFTFTNGSTLAPNGFFLLARNPAALATRYPGVIVNGIYSGKLNNDAETITLRHPFAGDILSVTYMDRGPWPVTADGFGFSLVRDPATGSYLASAASLGSPGAAGAAPSIGGVVVNELLSGSTLPLKDTVELLNLASTNVDISGWWLTDDPALPQKFRIPNGPPLAPGAFRVFTEDDFNPTPGLGVSFGLNSFGDDTYLFSADGAGNLTGYSHGFTYGASQDGVTFGRHVNSVGEEQFPPQILRTFDALNSGPRVGPVVFSEIHYHPRNPLDEFIELRNLTGSPVPLYDPARATNTWRINGLGYRLPSGVVLPANGCVLLVSDATNAFRARWSVSASVAIYQYPGNLQDGGEQLELQAPDLPTTNGIPYYSVETVRYNDRKPWPLSADGAGASLQRINPASYGNDPVNWLAATPTPGTHGLSGTPPSVTSHPASRTNGTTTTATFSVSATGTAPLFYQWRANGDNLAGATNSTLLLPNLQLADAGTYQAVVFNSAGSTDSSNALLVIRIGPSITNQPTNVIVRVFPDPLGFATNRATFTVGAITFNPPLTYQWRFNGVDIPDATNSTLSFSNLTLASEGAYSALVTDAASYTLSGNASFIGLVTPQILQAPLSQTVAAGSRVNASVVILGNPPPFGYQWRSNSLVYPLIISNSRTNFVSLSTATNALSTTFRIIVTNLASQLTAVNAAFTITTIDDTDGDGMPDSFELAYGASATGFDPAGDADGDGMSNLAEFLAGTDPGNASSYLRIDLAAVPGTAMIQFAAVSNRTYTVQYTEALPGAAAWAKLADVVARATNRVERFADPAWTTNRFYRTVTPRQP